MANPRIQDQQQPSLDIEISIPEAFNYAKRSQWLRAAVLGANDGLVTVSSIMMGVGAVKQDIKVMLLAGFAGLFAGACSMAIGEFVSVYTQLDIQKSQIKRNSNNNNNNSNNDDENLPNPIQAAMASALAFSVGAMVPLLSAAFIDDRKVRMAVVVVAAGVALVVFGGIGAVLGGTPVRKSCARVLVGGLMAMGITFGLTKLISHGGLEM